MQTFIKLVALKICSVDENIIPADLWHTERGGHLASQVLHHAVNLAPGSSAGKSSLYSAEAG